MGKTETNTDHHIVKFKCSACHVNIIYIKVTNHQYNNAPFKADKYICAECNQDLVPAIAPSKPTDKVSSIN